MCGVSECHNNTSIFIRCACDTNVSHLLLFSSLGTSHDCGRVYSSPHLPPYLFSQQHWKAVFRKRVINNNDEFYLLAVFLDCLQF